MSQKKLGFAFSLQEQMFITVSFAESHCEEHKYTILLCFLPRAKARECCERVCFGGWDLGVGSSLQEEKKKKAGEEKKKRQKKLSLSPFVCLAKNPIKTFLLVCGAADSRFHDTELWLPSCSQKNNGRFLNWPRC